VNDVDDAAVSGVLTALAGNPAVAAQFAVQASATLAAQGVEAVADTVQLEADPRPSAPVDLLGGATAPGAPASVANAPVADPDA
jgi:hypothetical protein